MSWLRFNRGDCPVCKGVRKDCRQSQDTNLVHCLNSEASPPDWIYRGEDRHGFGMWAYAPDALAWSAERKEEWRQERESAKKQREQQEYERQKQSLSAKRRDLEINKILSQLSLSDRHRQQLRDRGLTNRQIKNAGYRSVQQWQKLSSPVCDRLAGVRQGGKSLVNFGSGILCPIPNHQGLFVGWQIRQDDDSNGKYIWAASEKNRKDRPSAKTKKFDELPLGIWQQPNNKGSNRRVIGLTEGTGIKPCIASNKLNISIIGASGGNFASSAKTLRASLQAIAESEIVFYPDGGSVLNPHVLKQYKKTFDLLQKWSYSVKIAWWEQVQKYDRDVDEIDWQTLSNIQYLTPKEFFNIAKREQYIQQQRKIWSSYKKFTPQMKIEKKFVEFGLPQSDTITFIKSGLGSGKTTETVKHLLQLQKYGIIGLGYRNTLLLQFNEKAKEVGFYHLQSDKNLREFSLDNPAVKVTNCVDSLVYYEPDQFEDKIVIVDEVISVLKHLLFSPTIKHFSKVKELFTKMLNSCDRLICLDGFMQDWAVTFFKELCPSKQIVTIENIYQGNMAKVYLLEGTIDVDERPRVANAGAFRQRSCRISRADWRKAMRDEKIKANDKTPWIEKLLNSDCPAIASDSQVFCEGIEKLLQEQGRTGIRVDSKTVSEKRVKEFFIDPDKYIQENKPEYLIYSPSAESGLDVPTENYFDAHFAFFFGQLDVDSMIQMIGRIRDINVSKYVWAKKFILTEDIKSRPSNLQGIQANRTRSLMAELYSTLNSVESPEVKIAYLQQIYQNNLDPYTTAADTITAIRNHEFANYRECLKYQLICSGYLVEALTLEKLDNSKEIAKQEKEVKTEVKEQNSKDIYDASDKYVGQDRINLKFDANWETRCAVIKARLLDRLPGINQDPVWSSEFIKLIKYDRPNLVHQNRLYYLLENPELAKQLSLEKYNGIFNRGSLAAPWKLRQDYLKVKIFKDIGLYDFIQTAISNSDFTYSADSSQIKEIIDKCRRKKYQSLLGIPGKDSIKFINKLLRFVGVETKSKKIKQQGKTIRVYLLNRKHLLGEERLAILKAIKLKYEKKHLNNEALEWMNNIENNTEINDISQKSKSLDDRDGEVFDSNEEIANLADMLLYVECPKGLRELQKVPVFTRERLNRATRLLSLKRQRKLKQWAIANQTSTA